QNNRQISDKTSYNFTFTWNVTRAETWLKEVFPALLDHSSSYQTELKIEHQFTPKIHSTFGYDREVIKTSEKVPAFTHFGLGPRPEIQVVKDYKNYISAFYFQTQFQLSKKINFLLADRLDKSNEHGKAHSPKIALSFAIDEDEVIKLIYGKNFRWPSIFESHYNNANLINNPNIRSEKIISKEFQWLKTTQKNEYSIAFYQMNLKDAINLEHFIGPTGTRLAWYSNSDPAVHKGIEIRLKRTFNQKSSAFTSFGLHDVDENLSSAKALLVPTENLKQIQFGINHQINQRWRVNTYSSYFGTRTGTKYNHQSLDYQKTNFPSYTIHNLSLAYKIDQDRNFKLSITNLLDKEYLINAGTQLSSREGVYPKGRQFTISYAVKF
ncbi:TonB-dependent receptor, partial [bacterium]|nr:TonB-dependent receptor [bacterium]